MLWAPPPDYDDDEEFIDMYEDDGVSIAGSNSQVDPFEVCQYALLGAI